MIRLNVYVILGLLDGYYTTFVISGVFKGTLAEVMLASMVINLVTGTLSSYIINLARIREVERILLVRRGYLKGSLIYREALLTVILNGVEWSLSSAVGSLMAEVLRLTSGLLALASSLAVPLLLTYILSRILDIDYAPVALLTVILTAASYVLYMLR